MKKIKALFVALSLLGFLKGSAQTFCETNPNTPDFIQPLPPGSLNNPGPYTIRIFAHFIRTSAGTGGITTAEFNTALQVLSGDLSAHNICISLKGTDNINNDTYYNGDHLMLYPAVWQINNQPDAIDIYFHPNTSPNYGGIASGIPGSSISIGGTYPNGTVINSSPVISHEVGHCLGLFHCHHQLEQGGCADCNNGTNCTTCGDYVCDTPPSPYLNFFDCAFSYSTTQLDGCGAVMMPDKFNIMQYVIPTCMIYFSNGQGQRMRDHIANSAILQSSIVPDNIFLQNISFNTGNILYAVRSSITAGENVTTGTIGPVIFSSTNNGELKSHDFIELKPGFQALPNNSGGFLAWIDPNFCSVFINNNARVSTMPYKKLLDNTRWLTTTQGFEGNVSASYTSTGDSLVNGINYKVIEEIYVTLPGSNIINDPNILNGTQGSLRFLREDSIQRKVYYPGLAGEVLLYDFSLQVGSAHPSPFLTNYFLITIDSVLTTGGYNNRFIFSNSVDSIIWIEGIGNIAYPFWSETPYYFDTNPLTVSEIICVYKNSLNVYDMSSLIPLNCNNFLSVSIQEGNSSAIGINPNPSLGKFTISLNKTTDKILSIELYDVTGKIIFTKNKISNTSAETIDAAAFSNGVYFVKVKTSGAVYQEKIILSK